MKIALNRNLGRNTAVAIELIGVEDAWEPKDYVEGTVLDVKPGSKAAEYLLDPKVGLGTPVENVKAIAKEPAVK